MLDLCYVATGRLDVVYAGVASEGWKPWDYAAGMVVALEAGCSVESLIGNDVNITSKLCSNDAECRELRVQGIL